MTLTTREAVEEALWSLSASYGRDKRLEKVGDLANYKEAARVLCEHYGFKLSQFFDEGIDK